MGYRKLCVHVFWLCAALLAWTPAIVLVHCGDGGGKGEGDFCESDSDCQGEMVCRENVCVEPQVNPCEPPCNPEVEICHNGQCVIIADADDKDGDGSPAAEDCDDYDRTVHPDAFEYCDGKDNDCDSETDEDCPDCQDGASRPCGTDLGECTPGDQICTDGRWEPCSGQDPVPEKCDGLDNDCDGRSDENCPCENGDEFPCGTDEGECTPGVEICENGAWPGCLNGQLPAEGELCDGLDNDCDGLTDEGFELGSACGAPGECGDGVRECFAELDTGCSSGPGGSADGSAAELCNQLDDDCDAETDEDFTDLGAPCDGDDSDSCANGAATCTPDGLGLECVNETIEDIAETCNGQDDDCDGQTDEDYPDRGQPCDGDDSDLCQNGTFTCTTDGAGVECVNETVVDIAETCNQLDDDCDGQTDEGLDTDGDGDGHYAPGSCAQPADDCDDADPHNFPGNPELCDNQDNNCDTQIDEGFDGDHDGYTTCDLPAPDCNDTNGQINPGATEVCDGLDNDCNGRTDAADSGLQLPLCQMQAGVCQGARYSPNSCISGAWRPACIDSDYQAHSSHYISPSRVPTHTCSDTDARGEGLFPQDCDGRDNDCDGDTDGQDSDFDGIFEDSPDCDGDGHSACERGQINTVDDCCDTDQWTHSHQAVEYWDDPINGCQAWVDPYDYNCDGAETPDPSQDRLWSCQIVGTNCQLVSQGYVDSIPACGQAGTWAYACTGNMWTGCNPSATAPVLMRCR